MEYKNGWTSYLQSLNELGKFVPDLNSPDDLKNVFNLVQVNYKEDY